MDKSVKELAEQKAKLMADIDILQTKSRTENLSADEEAQLDGKISEAENIDEQIKKASREERIVASRERMAQPTRQAPVVPASHKASDRVALGEGFGYWVNSFGPDADRSPSAAYRARSAGFEIGNPYVKVPCSYEGLNFRQRTILSKGGSGSGSNLIPETYSNRVVEYLTYFSPLLGLVSTDVTGDGNDRTYFRIDDTAMISTYTSASSGTETNPTVPETNLATGSVEIKCFDITSGYQKASFNVLRDSAVSIEDKIAKANAHSHARFMEQQVLTATGNGATGVMGIGQAATALDDVAAWSEDALLDAIGSIPPQYRANAIVVSNEDTYQAVKKLRDDVGRRLFDRTAEQSSEFDTFDGKKWVRSVYCPDDKIYVFAPEFYQLRVVEGQIFQMFVEKFWPNRAWAGIMSFGGAWLGPASACVSLSLEDE